MKRKTLTAGLLTAVMVLTAGCSKKVEENTKRYERSCRKN